MRDAKAADPFAAPVTPVRGGWISLLFLANVGLWFALITPIQVLLPKQAALLAAADKELVFGIVTGVGALVAAAATPLAGLASDRTTSRFGRRHPWTLGGAVTGSAGFVVLANAPNIAVMTLGWCLVQGGLNATLAALTAALPDHVPLRQRASVAGVVGVTQVAGILVGTVVVTTLLAGVGAGYLACAVAVVAGAVAFTTGTADVVLPWPLRPDERLGDALRGLWVSPRRHPDFAWAWLGHFCTQVGNALGVMYLLFFLTDVVRLPDPDGGLLVAMLLYAAAVVVGATVTGRLSDRAGRRKPYVYVAVVLMGAAAALLVVWPTWPMTMAAAVVLGLGFGVYAAVGLALLTQVLPAASARAKDLGIVNIANSLPQVITPLIATLVLAHLGGYAALYATSAVVTLAVGALISRVRSVP
ncbi:Major Facilitator Superfamily protein [Amycolatopsis arida]|uniref:Major Facilitator Superfamily protein n=1 Tax=Amycolatopsis arida TaxID=587909 RepID=A0A1I5TYR1_9PSEU|nr:MFS transporter [Amycolatopsis arida]TDX95905.1 MFS transporter [Amycolatopsis arida]SFP88178.1 Major Facilitator Superfamily protein [Amycolatopsis arida]